MLSEQPPTFLQGAVQHNKQEAPQHSNQKEQTPEILPIKREAALIAGAWPASAVEPPTQGAKPPKGVVAWEEVMDPEGKRYYVSTLDGATQWDLPESGWVELVHDDGSRYYWDVDRDVTTWVRPTSA